MVFKVIINFVLREVNTCFLQQSQQPYIVPVCTAHSQSSVSLFTKIREVAVADDILKCIAARPGMSAFPFVLFEMVRFGEIVPGAK